MTAFASIIIDEPELDHRTVQGTSWPWTRAMGHDLLRHAIISDTRYLGSGTGGAPLGWLPNQVAKLSAYNMVSGQTSPPLLVGYEGSVETIVPYGIYTGGTNLERPAVERHVLRPRHVRHHERLPAHVPAGRHARS